MLAKSDKQKTVSSADLGRNTLQFKSSMLLLAEGALFVGRKLPVADAVGIHVEPDLILHAGLTFSNMLLRRTPAEASEDLVDLLKERAKRHCLSKVPIPLQGEYLNEVCPKQAKPYDPHLPHDGRSPSCSDEGIANQPTKVGGPARQIFCPWPLLLPMKPAHTNLRASTVVVFARSPPASCSESNMCAVSGTGSARLARTQFDDRTALDP